MLANPVRILIAEDDMPTRVLLCISLERAQWTVTRCETAEDALEVLRDNSFELFIVTLAIPIMGAIELITLLRANEDTENLPILLTLKRHSAAKGRAGIDAGANEYIVKPMLHHELLTIIRMMLLEGA